jgi:hypothetical protein
VLTLSGETHPTIQRSCALLATTAGPDSHGRGGALDGVSQSDLPLDEKARQTDTMQSTLILFLRVALFLHNLHLPQWVAAIDW